MTDRSLGGSRAACVATLVVEAGWLAFLAWLAWRAAS
jgi:hypothetical protein